MNVRKPLSADFCLCFLSAVLLISAYPKFDWWLAAWVGLIPLLIALDGKSRGAAFRLGFVTGVMFFTGTLYWFVYIHKTAMIPLPLAILAVLLLVSYLAVYFGVFAVLYVFFQKRPLAMRLLCVPACWVALEFIRDRLFTGFGWASLGHSQYTVHPLIQIADVTGVFGISFLVAAGNLLIKESLQAAGQGTNEQKLAKKAFTVGAALLTLVLVYGTWQLNRARTSLSTMRVAVVQGNIQQKLKWYPPAWPEILQRYIQLTEQAALQKPDLIIWPETSFPGLLWDADNFIVLKDYVRKTKIPLLFGAVTKEGEDYFNSAILLSADGQVQAQYRKTHLVPFGEFLPLKELFPFLVEMVGISDFTAGKDLTLFPSPPDKSSYSVLICFEDTIARVTRRFVRAGAQLLVNITNDGWFRDTKAPFLHLQASVFRAIENRRTLVRCANTGVSGFVDPFGRVGPYVQDDGKKTYVDGFVIQEASFQDQETFYTKFGDIFTYLCFSCILWGVVTQRRVS